MEIENSVFLTNLNRFLLALSIFIIINYKNVNISFEKLLRSFGLKPVDYSKPENKDKVDLSRLLIITPIIVMMYFDYTSESWTSSVGLNKIIPGGDKAMNYTLRTLGVYGIAYTFSKKIGLAKGVNQYLFTESNHLLRFFVLWGVAYHMLASRSGGLMGVLLLFMLRNNVSGGYFES